MDALLLSYGSTALDAKTALLCFLLAFVLSSAIAAVYERTFQGLSWSRGLLQSMVLGSLISCLLMIAIGDNVARGIGIVGSLAIIRFRTNLRDPRDLVFLFAALGVGVACGVQSFIVATVGAGLFCLAAILLQRSAFGVRRQTDGLIRFQAPSGQAPAERVGAILKANTRQFVLVTMRDVAQGEFVDCAYQVKLVRPEDIGRLLAELERLEGLRGLTFMNQASTVEV
ncbi:MAG: DUF4956 domain-containing protein [Myxococcales bacterium]|nr:MAG: DUF4956 domain-containing protein [Myxococcales bacterium]